MSRRHKRRSTSDQSDEHFVCMMEWLALESQAEVERMAERRQRRNAHDAEKSGETILDLAIKDHKQGLGGRFLVTFGRRNQERPMPWHRLRVGSPVVVTEYPDEKNGESLQGVVSEKKMNTLQVALNCFPDGRGFRVDLTADEITRQRQLAAITTAKDSRGRLGHLRQILMGDKNPRFGEIKECDFETVLNESQQQAVKFGLSAEDIAVIHGPPGTGKTTTVVELIIQAVRKGEKVLACAPSNTAVDNLLERLAGAKQRVVRVGHPARVAEDLRDHTLDGLVESSDAMPIIRSMYREAEEIYRKLDRYTRAKPQKGAREEMRREARRLKSDAKLLEKNTIAHILNRADIICATTTFNEGILEDRWFDLAVIDEACQSSEPGCWVSLLRCEKVVLAGDHQQLPPTVISNEAARQGFARSLMERQMEIYGGEISILLEVQYRMHDKIMDFSSNHFYDGRLTGHETVRVHRLVDLEQVAANELTESPVTFIDTAGAGWDEELEPDGESRRNPNEARLILKKVGGLIGSGVDAKDIAVIAPYAAQVRLLRELSIFEGVEIDTVDGFQGREKEAVLITLVRSNQEGEIGFLADVRRMNVALTRARRKLLVVGDSATIGGYEFYKKMLEYFESIGVYRTVWEEPND